MIMQHRVENYRREISSNHLIHTCSLVFAFNASKSDRLQAYGLWEVKVSGDGNCQVHKSVAALQALFVWHMLDLFEGLPMQIYLEILV